MVDGGFKVLMGEKNLYGFCSLRGSVVGVCGFNGVFGSGLCFVLLWRCWVSYVFFFC